MSKPHNGKGHHPGYQGQHYTTGGQCKNLSLSHAVEEYKDGKIRAIMTLKESQDQKSRATGPESKQVRKGQPRKPGQKLKAD